MVIGRLGNSVPHFGMHVITRMAKLFNWSLGRVTNNKLTRTTDLFITVLVSPGVRRRTHRQAGQSRHVLKNSIRCAKIVKRFTSAQDLWNTACGRNGGFPWRENRGIAQTLHVMAVNTAYPCQNNSCLNQNNSILHQNNSFLVHNNTVFTKTVLL